MKKILFLIPMFLRVLVSYADYTGEVNTSLGDLIFSTNSGYNVVSISNCGYTSQVGAPQLPVKTISFLIPIDKMVSSITINSTTTTTVSGTYTVYPVQTARINDTVPFVRPDTSIYNHTTPYPNTTYSVTNDGYPMGYHLVTITFYPLQYIPASHLLNLYTSINFTIVYENNTASVLLPNLQSAYSNNLSKEYIQSIVANPGDITTVTGGAKQIAAAGTIYPNMKGMNPTSLTTVPDYIIITRSDLVGDATHGFQMLANWKTQKGVNAIVVSTTDIYNNYSGYDDAEKIRNYLKDVLVNFGSTYILLGGDIKDGSGTEVVPARIAYIKTEVKQPDLFETDYYYATVQGNWNGNGDAIFGEDGTNAVLNYADDHADMSKVFFVGRAPAQTAADATNFSNKIIEYETLNNTATKSYVNNLAFWANDCSTDPITGCGNNGFGSLLSSALNTMQSSLLPSLSYSVTNLYYSNSALTHNNAVNSMNAVPNNHIIYHLDHSGFDNMSTSSAINQGVHPVDMDGLTNASLTNASYYNIIYTDGCNANDFANNSNSKHFINNAHGGGVAFLGNVDYGVDNDDSYFETYFMNSLYNTGTVNNFPSYDNSRYHIGYLNWWSAYGADITNNTFSYLKNRNLLGDPEMMVWTNTPQATLTVTPTYSSTSKTLTVTVSGISVATTPTVIVTATIWKGTEIYYTHDITTTTTTATYTFTNVVANTTGNILVTATAHNYIPATNTVTISTISGANPYVSSYTITDNGTEGSNGNSDGYADAGETIALPITVTNSGNATATNVTATYTWTAMSYQTQSGANATIAIGTNSVSLGSITSLTSATYTASPFTFSINTAAFDGITPRPLTQFINFTLSIYVNGSLFSTQPFALQIGEPNLIKGENAVTGTLAASSSNQLKIKIYNMGISQAAGTYTATLSKNADPGNNLTITSATSTYSNINGVENETNYGTNSSTFNFNIGALNSYSVNETFNLSVTNPYGRTWTFSNFDLTVPTASFTIIWSGNTTSINLAWTCTITSPSGDAILGYNLYRSPHSAGTYTLTNTDLIPYTCYLDQGLALLTLYDYELTVVDVSGNESAPYSFSANTSLPFHTGWPIAPSGSPTLLGGDFAFGSPNVYDLYDGTNNGTIMGNKEIFFTTGGGNTPINGGVWAFEQDRKRWYTFDGDPTDVNGYINYNNATESTPVLADIDNDGTAEMGVATRNGSSNSQELFVYKTIDASSYSATPQPTNFPDTIKGWEIMQGATVADIDHKGNLEVITNNFSEDNSYANGGLKVYNSTGTATWSNTNSYNCGWSMPVAFDFKDDGNKEIVIGCTSSYSMSAGIYVFDQDGTNTYSANPVYTPATGYRTDFPPVVADINNDGMYDILFISAKNNTANIYAYTPQTYSFVPGWDPTSANNPGGLPAPTFTLSTSVTDNSAGNIYNGQFCPSLSVGDLDKNGYPEVVCGNNGNLYVWKHDGTLTTTITPTGGLYASIYQAPILADIDNVPTDLEIIVSGNSGTGLSNIYAYKMNGNPVVGFPIQIQGAVQNSPCVDNIDDADIPGKNELIVTTPLEFYVWDSQGADSNNVYGWGSYRHDNYNSGVFYNMADGFSYDEDMYLQYITTGMFSSNANRYFFGRNIYAGKAVTSKKRTDGTVDFPSGTTIILEATNSVTLNDNVTVEAGCTFEIK